MKDHSTLPWSTVDWSLFNKDIGRQLGCSHITVHKYRQVHAPGTGYRRGRYDWSLIKDWNRRNDVIASELGCTMHAVNVYRNQHKIPPGPRVPGSGLWKQKRTTPVCEKSPCTDQT